MNKAFYIFITVFTIGLTACHNQAQTDDEKVELKPSVYTLIEDDSTAEKSPAQADTMQKSK